MTIYQTNRPPSHPLITGRNGAGAVVCPGAIAGDRVLGVINITGGANAASSFESTISVNGQIQQVSTGDASGAQFWAVLAPLGN